MYQSGKELNSTLISNAIYNNGYSPILPGMQSVGFRTNQMLYRENFTLHSVADHFFINSMHTRNDSQSVYSIVNYLNDSGVVMVSMNGNNDISSEAIGLSQGAPIDLELGNAIVKRRSIRYFTGDLISFDYLSTILRAANGISSKGLVPLSSGGEAEFSFRTHSSAGALYPVDLYLAVINVGGLNPGIYRFCPKQDVLIKITEETSSKKLFHATASSENSVSLFNANVIMLFVMTPWKSMRKYGPRGLRFAFHESGAIAQNIHLSCVALGLGSMDYASFYEDEVNELLELDGISQSFTHAVVIGCHG
jgi:SagB-type dehydrogenase family enzyme